MEAYQERIQNLTRVNLYKQFKDFLDTNENNLVNIILKPGGIVIITKSDGSQEEHNFKNWII